MVFPFKENLLSKTAHATKDKACYPKIFWVDDGSADSREAMQVLMNGGTIYVGKETSVVKHNNGRFTIRFENNGLPHRDVDLGPAVLASGGKDNGGIDEYWVNGKTHNQEGPAKIWGSKNRVEYWVDGRLHCLHGPAIIDECPVAKRRIEEYWVDGRLHSNPMETPAVVRKYEVGEYVEYWVHGKRYKDFDSAKKAWLAM